MNRNNFGKRPYRTATIGTYTILLTASMLLVSCSPSVKAAIPEKQFSDGAISSAVEDGLISEKGVRPNDIDVTTNQGIVLLSGTVNNLLAKERAIKIAESIRGVRGAVDRITVTPLSRPDADIRKDILLALLQDPATESFQIGVSVHDAVAALSGMVSSSLEKQLCGRIAKGVKGLKGISNDIAVNYVAKRTDSEISADVKANLQWDIWINGDVINTTVKDGKVTLTGTVGSVRGKTRAMQDAWAVRAVTSVNDSGVKIDPWISNDTLRKSRFPVRSDSEIQRAIQAAFHLDPRVTVFPLNVSVDGGVVRIGGVVGNLKAKASAEQDVKDIVGVFGVTNVLKVRPVKQYTDAEMKNQLNAALVWNPLLDGCTINVTVVNHVADLSGTVGSPYQKAEAQDVASRTKGLLLVRNHLKVEPEFSMPYYDWPDYYSYRSEKLEQQPYLSDVQIKKNIEKGFFWSPFIDRDSIKVAVNNGVATLTGSVANWIGWNEVDKDSHESGATEVTNHVKIRNDNREREY